MPTKALFRSSLFLLTLTLSLYGQQTRGEHLPSMNNGSVTGSVRTLDDRPVSSARVELRDSSTGSSVAVTYTLDIGTFELYNITPGDYEVAAIQGTDQTHEHVRVTLVATSVSLRMNSGAVAPADTGATVSVSKMKVPEKAVKEYTKAAEAFHGNKLEEARKHVEKALSIYPNYAEALVIRGILAVGDKKMDEGQADLQQAIKADPSYGMGYIAMGATLNEQQKFQDAKRSLERGVSLAPDAWQGYFEMSKANMGLDEYDAALKNAEHASSLSKEEYAPVRLIKAHALMGLRHYDQAVAELEQFLSRNPDGPSAQYARNTLDKAKAFAASNGGK